MFESAGRKLVAWNVAVLSVILTISGFFVYALFTSHVFSEVDHQLDIQRAAAVNAIVRNGEFYAGLENAPYDVNSRTVITNRSLQVIWTTDCPGMFPNMCRAGSTAPTSTESLEAALRNPGGIDRRTVTFQNEPQRVETFSVADTAGNFALIQISRNVSGQELSLHKLAVLLLLSGLLGLFLSGVGSLFLAHRALVPIRRAFSRQRQFTADASHELRTPLALIRANAEMLGRSSAKLHPEDAELVDDIIRETDHLNRLVGDLLTLARADSEQLQIARKPVDLRALVNDVHEDLSHIADSQGISSEMMLDGPVTIQGDEGRLRQLLLILLDNALKYTDPGGRVDMSLTHEDHHARLVVSDTGIGIPANDLPRVFERFYRVDRAREHESGGTGLGLSIARWIVQAHGGTIKAESEQGQGTKMLIELPMAAEKT